MLEQALLGHRTDIQYETFTDDVFPVGLVEQVEFDRCTFERCSSSAQGLPDATCPLAPFRACA